MLQTSDCPCYHCGEPVPPGYDFSIEINGENQPMCCPGCRAVASLIAESGLGNFYSQRTAYSERPEASNPDDSAFSIYNDPELAATFSDVDEHGITQAQLLLGGMTCAACTWLIESTLSREPGVENALVNLQQNRLDIRFDHARMTISSIFERIAALGYRPQPFQGQAQKAQIEQERKLSLRRVAVAGIGMMQVGMFGIALHAGDLQGISDQYQGLLRWVSLLVASFIVLYCARPFFSSAWRHLRVGALVMDLPVSLAIGLAWLASVWATVTSTGQVYFDSVVMFTFFLLLGRFMEERVRHRHSSAWFDLEASLPAAITVKREQQWQQEARHHIAAGDTILLRAGETIPLDACLISAHSSVREDSFNGEHLPRQVGPGDTVYAGTVNIDTAVEARVLYEYSQSRLAALQRSVDVAQTEKPRLAQLADRIASWFVAGVLLLTAITALVWLRIDSSQALWISLSVLVISCPCALALATPAALTSAASSLRSAGVVVRGENALAALAASSHIIFDKTGTLTRGRLRIAAVIPLGDMPEPELLGIARAMQQYSNHPVAGAFEQLSADTRVTDIEFLIGAGMSASLQGQSLRLGSESFCRELQRQLPAPPDNELYWIALCSETSPLAWIGLSDEVRPEAKQVISELGDQGLKLELLTGDSSQAGEQLADQLAITQCTSGVSPEEKMQHVKALQAQGAVVTMIGDGLNDAPVLKMANCSFAVPGATDLAQTQADFVIADGNLYCIVKTLNKARQCRRIIKQNFCWALTYNLCGIPLAAMGFVPPWAAAIGMSVSSLLVVLNSLRLNKRPANLDSR